MTNYKKIKKLIEAGFMVKTYNKKDDHYCIFSSIKENGDIRRSSYEEYYTICINTIGTTYESEEEINSMGLELTPIPHLYKEIKGKVDIIDCPEIGEMANKASWLTGAIDMIGKKGLLIKEYCNGSYGQFYLVYAKDESYYFTFPAWCVVPHMEEETIKIGDKEYNKNEFEDAVKDLRAVN